MKLRGVAVFARSDDAGRLLEENGRVEIRYTRDSAKAYRAHARNLEASDSPLVFPDDHCPPADVADVRERKENEGSSAKKPKKQNKASNGAFVPPPQKPQSNEVLVYADGACSGNPGLAGAGVIIITHESSEELSEFLGQATNNIAELTAVLRALQKLRDQARPIHIYTDSSYTIGVLSKGWKAKANKELIEEIRALMASMKTSVRFFHVPAHVGIPLNEQVDRLARKAVESQASEDWTERLVSSSDTNR